ncbi:hypothetical protein [Candidatus Palauibacter polyketidifaciens]|uniref:hypothetical protein n=1 Tax=Candidatus Palauibacter polyketidifaciens TaxID=3056740 RepID=UPI0023867C4A|nr:hypothetical protein [Candidatus Palauibacter polyketidifaciens]MDE2719250.1 hypothetical protein [Candidatus Palauibacter polyketidifaciens]
MNFGWTWFRDTSSCVGSTRDADAAIAIHPLQRNEATNVIPRLRQDIEDIAKRIKEGRFESEAQVSVGVVQRLLGSLGWPRYDTQIVIPEFAVGGGRRVDYALCHPQKKAVVLVEVKKPGAVNPRAEEQLFGYCVRVGVPIAVLTDGQTWHFFLPAGQGSFEERCFARVDLTSDDSSKAEKRLLRYLQYEEVKDGRSPENAQQDLTRARLDRAYRQAWRRIVEEPANKFLRLFIHEVKNVAALDPSEDDAATWLRRRASARRSAQGLTPPKLVKPPQPPPPKPKPRDSRCWVEFRGERHAVRNGIEILVRAFTLLAEEDPSLCQRVSEKHRWLTRDVKLKPMRILHRDYRQLPGGWWIYSNIIHHEKSKRIEQACQVAGVRFGRDLKIQFPGQQPVPPKPELPVDHSRPQEADSQHWVEFRGERHAVRNGIEVLVRAFTLLAQDDPTFCRRYSDRYQRKTRDRKLRPRVARTRSEIHPNDAALRERCRSLPGGWWVDSNVSNRSKRVWVEQACGLTRFRFGEDLRIHFPEKSADGS